MKYVLLAYSTPLKFKKLHKLNQFLVGTWYAGVKIKIHRKYKTVFSCTATSQKIQIGTSSEIAGVSTILNYQENLKITKL